MLTSLWMGVDMVLDMRQTFIYYDHAFNPNGTYASWALEYNKTTNGTKEAVHSGYFYTSIVVWVLPPFLHSAIWFLLNLCRDDGFDPFYMANVLFAQFSSILLSPPTKKGFPKFLVFALYPIFDLFSSAIWIYIFIPFMSLKSGIIIAMTGKDDGKRRITKMIAAEGIPFWKLFENIGEAVPQAIMCLLFISNNFDFILHEETSTWMPIPLSIVSLIFSVGSIAMGLYTGFKSCGNANMIYFEDDDDDDKL